MSNLEQVIASAVDAQPALESLSARVTLLRGVADALDDARDALVPVAERETRLGTVRLVGEIARTSFQLRLMADVVTEGTVFDARIDHALPDWPPGPRPDLRRISMPVGSVVVFAASNFPFAFSVVGGDTASAWAAGCPVVLKAHPGHPELSRRVAQIAQRVASDVAPGALGLIEEEDDGRAAVVHPDIRAGAFTGSLRAGRALFDLACTRPEPIPFYAEMGSINPVFVTPSASRARMREIAEGFVSSFALGSGQFCTKPGLLVVPDSFDVELIRDAANGLEPAPLLHMRIADGYARGVTALTGVAGIETLVSGRQSGLEVTPSLALCSVETVIEHADVVLAECFGPMSVIATYRDVEPVLRLAGSLEGQLTATVHAEQNDDLATSLVERLAPKAGRVVHNGWPTGVSVTWAMQHGGPYPATTAPSTTSVGTAAVERFTRPLCFQDMPDQLLPPAIQEANPWNITRRVDGRLIGAEVRRKP
jgi:NADP-dependent aldehyde dehydrogenase